MSDKVMPQVPLRIRFEKDVSLTVEQLSSKFESIKETVKPKFLVNLIDRHVWISINHNHRKYYSPNLHLEFEKTDENNTHIRCLFGPESGLWTMFMFLHFAVAGIFTMFLAFAYANWSMGHSYLLDIVVMLLMVIAWFLLYFFARLNRKRGLPQAHEILNLMEQVIEGKTVSSIDF